MQLTGLVAASAAAGALAVWPPPAAARLQRLRAVPVRPVRPAGVVALAAAGQFAAFVVGAPVVGLGVLAAATAAHRGLRAHRHRRLRAGRAEATVEVVHALAGELRAGCTPAQALQGAAVTASALRQPLLAASRAVRSGAPAADRLRSMATLPGCEALGAVAAAWQVTEQAGGAVADVLDRLGGTLDAEVADRRAFEAALAGPRATIALLAGLPALGVAMAQSAGAHPLDLLLHRRLGWALLAAAGVLEAVGLAWSRRLARAGLAG
ncbi:MAG TPA: type II secretion system F family protein [Mycobacteriales bacterium]|nr:type II secretion system F family protein [Mycobacteriales bacterium]